MSMVQKYRGFVWFLREEINEETNLLKEIPIVYISIRNIVAVYDRPRYDGKQETLIQTSSNTFTINLPIEKVMNRIDGIPMN